MLAQKNERDHPGLYKVIRYEDMVTAPEKTLRDVCEFLEEDFHIEMVLLENEARFSNSITDDDNEMTGPLTTKFIGRFQSGLSAREVSYIQKYAGKQMTEFGYPPKAIHFSWYERLRFHILDETVNMLYMLGWQIRSTTQN